MGIWTAHSSGNKESLDWLTDLIDEQDPYFIHNTLEIIVDYPRDESPDSWDCYCALAAAEMVAAACGCPQAELPAEARAWLKAYNLVPDSELLGLARKAIDRIESSSALTSVGEESHQSARWYDELADLRRRLGV